MPAAPSSTRAVTSSTPSRTTSPTPCGASPTSVRAEVNDAMRTLRAELASAAREAKQAATSASGDAVRGSRRTNVNVDSNRAVHEADIVLNEFRQQLRTDLRTQAHRGRVSSESMRCCKSRLAEVRADVLATLAASE